MNLQISCDDMAHMSVDRDGVSIGELTRDNFDENSVFIAGSDIAYSSYQGLEVHIGDLTIAFADERDAIRLAKAILLRTGG